MVYGKRRRSWGSMAYRGIKKVAPYVRTAMDLRARYANSFTQTQTKRNYNQSSLTHQRDSRRVYRRKRMPYRKRKRWVSFVKKVGAVMQSHVGSRSVVFNDYTVNTVGANSQGYGSCVMYGVLGTNENGTDDMHRLSLADSDLAGGNEKVKFGSGVLDVTISNTGSVTAEFDVYEFYVRKTVNYDNFIGLILALFSQTPNVGTTGLSLGIVGVTLFQVPLLGGFLKITKKTKYFIPPEDQITYQIRDAKNRFFNTMEFTTDNGVGVQKKGFTHGFFYIYKGVPTTTDGSGAVDLALSCTRTYNYKIFAESTGKDGRIP